MKKVLTSLMLGFIYLNNFAQEVTVSKGRLDRLMHFKSEWVDSRNIDIWLPEGYDPTQKYAVLYMHDGQMLYDETSTWNKQAWNVEETISALIGKGRIAPCIVVGIWNNGAKRHVEYFPQEPYSYLSEQEKQWVTEKLTEKGRTNGAFEPISDRYLQFIVRELKPYIDKQYATFADKEHTFIAGSSMGGLISMYAICEYPDIFGGAACLSTHWPGVFSVENNPIPQQFLNYLKKKLPVPKNHTIYFDYGDQTLDALYPALQKKVDAVMVEKGFDQSNWKTQFFPGKDHSEQAWAERFETPLTFLLGRIRHN